MKPGHDPNRPTVPDVVPLVKALHARPGGAAGCCLHIMVDDPNYEDGNARSCLETARENGHADCIQIAEMMVRMTRTQRAKVAKLAR